MDLLSIAIDTVKVLTVFFTFLTIVPIMVWAERRGAALIQDRPGPNRVGPLGLLQPVADAVKFLWKEDPIPTQANGVLYTIAPFLSLLPASLILAVIPFGDHIVLFDRTITLQITDLSVGLLYMLAISSLGIYGILFGGWASNNKYSLIGAMRSSSQIISYEIPLALAAVGVVLIFGTFSLRDMVLAQEGVLFGFIPRWGILYQPLGFLLFFIAAFAETNRLPFDLPESEAELVGGFHTEYGSMKFATFFLSEYMSLTSISCLMVTMYFGGWHLPWVSDATMVSLLGSQTLVGLLQVGIFFAKVTVFLCIFIWVRWTIPRFRFDQLMHLAWKNLIPLAIFNVIVTAVVLYLLEGR